MDLRALEFGVDSFGELSDSATGGLISSAQTLRSVVDLGIAAEAAGFDFVGLGEHHSQSFAISVPEVVLAAIAANTSRIRLGSAVTVLTSDDPRRVLERFATVDAVSSGRAEIIVGRGAFDADLMLFGIDPAESERVFVSKLNAFLSLRADDATSVGREAVVPVTPVRDGAPIPVWLAIGGSDQSVARAVELGLPIFLSSLVGDPLRHEAAVRVFRARRADRGMRPGRVGLHVPGYVADSDWVAEAELWPYVDRLNKSFGRERRWAAMSRKQFHEQVGPGGNQLVGSPASVAVKVARVVAGLGLSRFVLKIGIGSLPHSLQLRSVHLFGSEVIPRVRELLRPGSPDSG